MRRVNSVSISPSIQNRKAKTLARRRNTEKHLNRDCNEKVGVEIETDDTPFPIPAVRNDEYDVIDVENIAIETDSDSTDSPESDEDSSCTHSPVLFDIQSYHRISYRKSETGTRKCPITVSHDAENLKDNIIVLDCDIDDVDNDVIEIDIECFNSSPSSASSEIGSTKPRLQTNISLIQSNTLQVEKRNSLINGTTEFIGKKRFKSAESTPGESWKYPIVVSGDEKETSNEAEES
jgi:hypothetical protein